VPDSDRIDIGTGISTVSILNHAVAIQSNLVALSDRTLFVLEGQPLTPKTAALVPIFTYDSSATAEPVQSAGGLFFAYARGGIWAGVRELKLSQDTGVYETEDISTQIPKYMAGTALQVAGSTTENTLVLRSTADRTRFYIYKYYFNGPQRLQSSWSAYTLGTGGLYGFQFIESTLYLLISRQDGIYIEKMVLGAGITDSYSGPFADAGVYLTRLDRKINESQLVSAVYVPASGYTELEMPYGFSDPANYEVVTRATGVFGYRDGGRTLPILGASGVKLRVSGDHATTPLYIGRKYTMRYRFSRPSLKATEGRGQTVLAAPRFQLLKGTVLFGDSLYFRVAVTPDYGTEFTYEYNDRPLNGEAPTGPNVPTEPKDGQFSFPIRSLSSRVSVEITNDSALPSNILSAEWEAQFNQKSTRFQTS